MGFFDFLKKDKNAKAGLHYAPSMSGGAPFYTSFGDNIYMSDIVVESIRCKANEFKKLDPRHIRTTDTGQSVVNDSSVARVLRRPNELMTISDFLEKIVILRELNKNVYIYPTYYMTKGGERYYTGLYPLKPSNVEYLIDASGKLYIHLCFASGYEVTLPASEIIHWRKDFGVNEYFGGSVTGANDNAGTLKMLQRYDQLTQGIAKALECSCQVNGIVKINTYLDDEKSVKAREDFEADLKANKSGILFVDNSTEFTAMPREVKLVDSETLDFFYQTILRANGTPLCILNGDYTKAQKEAYYEHALEADIKALGQVMSKVMFTDREESFGNAIILYPNDISFMSMENKIAALQTGLPAGIFTKNEARELLGYPPIEGGDVMPRGYNEVDGKGTEPADPQAEEAPPAEDNEE